MEPNLLQMLILSVLQGFAGIFPLSASGFLVIARQLSGLPLDGAGDALYTALQQLAMAITVCVVFRRELAACLQAFSQPPRRTDTRQREAWRLKRRLMLLVVVGFIVSIPGALLEGHAGALGSRLPSLACLLLANGFVIFLADRIGKGSRALAQTTLTDSLWIGAAQAVAVVPGLSRTGLTMTTCLVRGLEPEFAFRFSFVLGAPVLLLRALVHVALNISGSFHWLYLVGMGITALCSYVALWLLRFVVRRGNLGTFAYILWGAGFFTFIMYLIS